MKENFWLLTRHDVYNVDWGYSTENCKHIWYIWEHNRNWTCGDLKTDCAYNVELCREIFFASSHEIEWISKWNVIQHDIRNHSWEHQDWGGSLKPVCFPFLGWGWSREDNLRGIVQSWKIASQRHYHIETKDEDNGTFDDFHESVFDGIDQLLVNGQHITLVCERKQNNACPVKKLSWVASIGHLEAVWAVVLLV